MSRRVLLAGLAGVAVAALAGWVLLGSGLLVVRAVSVRGTHRVADADVRAAVAAARGSSLVTLDTAGLARRVAALAGVAAATVHRAWPDGMTVDVRERVPVAAVRRADGWWLLDGSGTVFGPPAPAPPAGLRTAALSGADAPRAAASVLGALPPAVAAQVAGVTATGRDAVALRLAGGSVVVWGGADRAQDKARALAALMRRPARRYDVSTPGVVTTR